MSLRDYFYLVAIAVLLVGGALWHHEIVSHAQTTIKAQDALAAAQQTRAVAAQVAADAKATAEVIHDLQDQIAHLRSAAPPVRVVRLCQSDTARSGGVSTAAATASATQSASAAAASTASVPLVSSGTGGRPDIGPELRDFATACAIVSAYQRAAVAWAVSP